MSDEVTVAPSALPGLSWAGLTLGYGAQTVLRNVSASPLPAGKVVAVLGPNGSGKSTLLKALAGVMPVHQGQVLWAGRPLPRAPSSARARLLAYLPQALPPAVRLRVVEAVTTAERLLAPMRRGADDMAKVHSALAALGIEGLAMRYLDTLSGGQRQLVGLAQMLVRDPRVLLLDEPLSALDLYYQYRVLQVLLHHTRARQAVTLMVLHDLDLAARVADEVLILAGGDIVAQGRPSEILSAALLAEVYGVRARVEPDAQGVLSVRVEGVVESRGYPLRDPVPESGRGPRSL